MNGLRPTFKYLLAAFFVTAGVYHFVNPQFYLRMMPPYLPWHEGLVFLSGLCEIGLGLLVLVPRYMRLAGWGLVALLIAIFPANLHMALNTHHFPEVSPAALYLRLPFQLVFIAWVYWTAIAAPERTEESAEGRA